MGRSIQGMYDNFKRLLSDDVFFYSALLVLIAISSFGLGRFSMATNMPKIHTLPSTSVIVTKNSSQPALQQELNIPLSTSTPTATAPLKNTKKIYVGSRNGTKYHLLTCSGAQHIKETNKIFFSSKEDAQKAGYTPSNTCKGI